MFQQQSTVPLSLLRPPFAPPICFPPISYEDNDLFINIGQAGQPGPPGPQGPAGPQGPPGSLADLPVTLIDTATYSATVDEYFLGVITDTPCTITLPAGTLGKAFIIKDSVGDSSTNNITIVGSTIDGQASYVLKTDWSSIGVVYNGIEWNVV
jgi:hypothetical protein